MDEGRRLMRRFETFLTILVALSAVVVAGTFVIKHFRPSTENEGQLPIFIENWERYSRGGLRVGPVDAPIQIVAFGDFQCPFCSSFHEAVVEIMDELPGEVSLTFRHFPLQNHAFAAEAGEAAECAANQGRFGEIARGLFSLQDSIGVIPWSSFAESAGVGDLEQFSLCMEGESSRARVEADRNLGSELALTAVPTVLVNGWRYPSPPTNSLPHIVQELVEGRSPFPNR
jgi:protein-disulfide isomerase